MFSQQWDLPHSSRASRSSPLCRPTVLGKSVYCGETKLWIKGVTYGTFRPDESESSFTIHRLVESDFDAISSNGFNCIRTYTVPPLWVLGLASKYGLRVMVGLPWEQHITFLDSTSGNAKSGMRSKARIRNCSRHPAILCYALGSEIPAPIARWYGARRIERFLRELWADAKSEDPEALFTYVNYPSTEYLDVAFADLFCFNVYLENREQAFQLRRPSSQYRRRSPVNTDRAWTGQPAAWRTEAGRSSPMAAADRLRRRMQRRIRV